MEAHRLFLAPGTYYFKIKQVSGCDPSPGFFDRLRGEVCQEVCVPVQLDACDNRKVVLQGSRLEWNVA